MDGSTHQRHIYDAPANTIFSAATACSRSSAPPDPAAPCSRSPAARGAISHSGGRALSGARTLRLRYFARRCSTPRAASIARAGLSRRIAITHGDAAPFTGTELFGVPNFDRVFISYALSMIPPWRDAVHGALVVCPRRLAPCRRFRRRRGCPARSEPACAHGSPSSRSSRATISSHVLGALAAERGMTCTIETRFRGYAVLAVAR